MCLPGLYFIAFFFLGSASANLKFASLKEAPFVVSIRRTEYEQNFGYGHHHCTGALVDTTTIVTAASCLYDTLGNAMLEPKSFTIVAGTRYLLSNNPEDHGVIRECDKIIQHPYYDPVDHSNDIAYMKIVIPYDTTSGDIKPIDLSNALLVRDTVCATYGWAWLNESSSTEPKMKVLYAGNIQIVSKQICSAKFDKFEIGLQGDKICAQVTHNKDSCVDLDAGGILVCYKKLVGVVSIYSDCSLYDYPTVFTHIPSHLAFLETRKEVLGFQQRSACASRTGHILYVLAITLFLINIP